MREEEMQKVLAAIAGRTIARTEVQYIGASGEVCVPVFHFTDGSHMIVYAEDGYSTPTLVREEAPQTES